MNGVPTVFVAFASMGTVTLLDGSPIHDRTVMGLSPVLLTMIVSRSPIQFGDENILRAVGVGSGVLTAVTVGTGVGAYTGVYTGAGFEAGCDAGAAVGAGVGVAVIVALGDAVGLTVAVALGVGVTVEFGIGVGVGVAVATETGCKFSPFKAIGVDDADVPVRSMLSDAAYDVPFASYFAVIG
jgi:hypothetical protein